VPNDFKPVGPTLDQVNAANRAAWDSGEFRHGGASDGWPAQRSVSGANKVIKTEGPLTKAQSGHAEKVGKISSPGKLNGGKALSSRQVAQLEHPQNDEGQLFKSPKAQKVSPTPSPEEMRASVKAAQEKRGINSEENPARAESIYPPSMKRRDGADAVRHPPEGGQEVARGGQVVSHHDSDDPEAELTAKLKSDKEKRDYEAVNKRRAALKANPNEAKRESRREPSIGDESSPKRAVHLPRKASRTWRKTNWE
jgi:hypothetical protein